MKEKDFIEDLFRKRSTFHDPDQAEMMSNLLETVSSDIYSESQRFVFELIQNADDATVGLSNQIQFDFYSTCIVISHFGKAFDSDDIRSLTNAGASTKVADPTKTGYKGIGFKSVFGKSNRVTIFSNGFQFRFDKSVHTSKLPWQVIPIWTEISDLPSEVKSTLEKNNFAVCTIIELSNPDELFLELKQLLCNSQILLFLRSLNEISIFSKGAVVQTITKECLNESNLGKEISLLENGKLISTWIVKTFENIVIPNRTQEELRQDEKTPPKLKEIKATEISFAAKIEGLTVKPLSRSESIVFTYLPTKVTEFELPFLINGNFLTNASREALHEDRVWNQWLFEQVAEKSLDWLVLFAASKYKFQLLKLLRLRFNSPQNSLKSSFDKGFDGHVFHRPFVVTTPEIGRTISEVLLDKTGLSELPFIDKLSIIEFLKDEKRKQFDVNCFVHPKLVESNRLKSLGVEIFEPDHMELFFASKAFTSRHLVQNNFDLIKYFYKESEDDKEGVWFQILRNLPFIYDEEEKLRNPSNGVCFPIGLSSTELGNIPVIHAEVFERIKSEKPIYDWFKKLGVKEPSSASYVTNVIIPGIKSPDYITTVNYLHITHYLFRLFMAGELDDDMIACLRELPVKVKNSNDIFVQAQRCFLSNKYKPELRIDGVVHDVFCISEDYLFADSNELEWNLFFRAIKVKDRVEVDVIDRNNSLPVLRELTKSEWVDQCMVRAKSIPGSFGFGDSNVIDNLRIPSFLNFTSNSLEYAVLFWKNLIQNENSISSLIEEARFRYGVGYGQNKYSCAVENYFAWFVRNTRCIPTSTGELLKSADVFINDKDIKQIVGNVYPAFDCEEPLSESWKGIFRFKSQLELGDCLGVLARIVEQQEVEGSNTKAPVRRIGMIYSKLMSLLENMTEANKQTISQWAVRNKLLSVKGTFEPSTELKLITIDGFSPESDGIKIIRIPDSVDMSLPTFNELLGLFHVHVIDRFNAKFENMQPENFLKNRLEVVLPSYAALIGKRKSADGTSEFERLYAILNKIDFYRTTNIQLTFDHAGETIQGPSLAVYREETKFYYRSPWKSERTMMNLIKELCVVLRVEGLNEQLRFLLLEDSESEITVYMEECGITKEKIPSKRAFKNNFLVVEEPQVEYPEKKKFPNESDSNSYVTGFVEKFAPTNTPKQYDTSKINVIRKESKVQIDVTTTKIYASVEDPEERIKIGLWCEEFVYEIINSKKDIYTDVIWENKNGESGKPYDITFLENGNRKFIDVKGTTSHSKDIVYLSSNEWNFMFKNGANYSIYRVYGAGLENIRIESIDNPSLLIQSGLILPNPVALQI